MPEHEANWKRRLRPGPAVVLGAAAAGIFLWRTLSWPAAASPDAWAYTSWGEALLRAERPAYELTSTTPKPLGTILGALASPLPPERALGVVVALSVGVLVGALFAAGQRRAGAVAGVAAVLAFLAVSMLPTVLAFQLIDAVTAALIALAFALRGRVRIPLIVLTGLARPEAWPLAGVAGFSETTGRLRRRVVAAAVSAAAAPLLWLAFDAVTSGDPLKTSHRADMLLGARASEGTPWSRAFDNLVDRFSPGRFLVGALCVLGLALHARARGREGDVLLPAATVVAWLLVLAYEARRGLLITHRYLLPVLVALALGAGLLVARFLPPAFARWNTVGAAAAAAAVVVVAVTMTFDADRWANRIQDILATGPTVERSLACGTVAIAGPGKKPGVYLAALAVATRRSLHEFDLARRRRERAALLVLFRKRSDIPPSSWRREQTPLGLLALSPPCAARLAAPG